MTQAQLLNFAADLGHALMRSGAEIYRVEESLRRLFLAYEQPSGEVFAIPNCLIVSLDCGGDNPATRMRRAAPGGIDVELLEALNALCRRLCCETPDNEVARALLQEAQHPPHQYSFWGQMLGYLLATSFFALFFGGNLVDALFSAAAGALIYLAQRAMRRSGGSFFIRTLVGGIIAGVVALVAAMLAPNCNMDMITIGAIMVLVPGMTMTNGVRDIMSGDTMSGISKLCEALLIAAAIALGVGAVLGGAVLTGLMPTGITHSVQTVAPLLKSVYAFFACTGFCILYNIRGAGLVICALGGAVGSVAQGLVGAHMGVILQSFFAAVAISVYAETMARVRKCPVTGYQFVALFPLVPGGGIYYTMSAAIDGNLDRAVSFGMETLGIAGMLSLGILLVSAVVRMMFSRKGRTKIV